MTAATPRRIRRSRARGSKLPGNTICVDRSTKWGNPFVVGEHGTRAECAQRHRALLAGYICIGTTGPDLVVQMAYRAMVIACRHELRGKNLACWCSLCAKHAKKGRPFHTKCEACGPCHADPLLEVAQLPVSAPVAPARKVLAAW